MLDCGEYLRQIEITAKSLRQVGTFPTQGKEAPAMAVFDHWRSELGDGKPDR